MLSSETPAVLRDEATTSHPLPAPPPSAVTRAVVRRRCEGQETDAMTGAAGAPALFTRGRQQFDHRGLCGSRAKADTQNKSNIFLRP